MEPVELARLSRQCQDIVAVLSRGTATNQELSRISLKYTSRISDLRKRGWNVQVVDRDVKRGITWYALVPQQGTQASLF